MDRQGAGLIYSANVGILGRSLDHGRARLKFLALAQEASWDTGEVAFARPAA